MTILGICNHLSPAPRRIVVTEKWPSSFGVSSYHRQDEIRRVPKMRGIDAGRAALHGNDCRRGTSGPQGVPKFEILEQCQHHELWAVPDFRAELSG